MSGPPPYSFCEESQQCHSKAVTTPRSTFQPVFEHNLNIALSQFDDSEAAKSGTNGVEHGGKHQRRKKMAFCLIGLLITATLAVATAISISIVATKNTHNATKLFQPIQADAQRTAPIVSTCAESTDGPIVITKTTTVLAETMRSSSASTAGGTVTVTVTASQTSAQAISRTLETAPVVSSPPAVAGGSSDLSIGTPQFSYDPTATETATGSSSSSVSVNLNGIIIVPLSSTTISGVPTAIPAASPPTDSQSPTHRSSSSQEPPTKTVSAGPSGTDHIAGGKLGFCGFPGSACMT